MVGGEAPSGSTVGSARVCAHYHHTSPVKLGAVFPRLWPPRNEISRDTPESADRTRQSSSRARLT